LIKKYIVQTKCRHQPSSTLKAIMEKIKCARRH